MSASDRRRDPRVRVKVRLEITEAATGRHHNLNTTNLSIGGALCCSLEGPPEGAMVAGQLFLPLSEAGRDVDVTLPIKGRVMRSENAGHGCEIGLSFDTMSEADRAELSAYLFAWLADDTTCPQDDRLVGARR